MPSKRYLVCLDFDLTMTAVQLHNACVGIIKPLRELTDDTELKEYEHNPVDYLWKNLTEEQKRPAGDAAKWRLFLKKLTEEHDVAIVSRNKYEGIIKKFLQTSLELDENILSKIFIKQGNTSAPNKVGHIVAALGHFCPTEKTSSLVGVIMIDDSPREFEPLEQLGCVTIPVEEGADTNVAIVESKLPEAIEKVKVKRQLEFDLPRVEWLGEQLALASRLADSIVINESFSSLNRILIQADNPPCFLKNLIKELEAIYFQQLNLLCKRFPWGDRNHVSASLAADFLNKTPSQNHLMRMTGLILKEAYKKYPDVVNKRIEGLIKDLRDSNDSYKERTSKGITRLAGDSTAKKDSEQLPYRSRGYYS